MKNSEPVYITVANEDLIRYSAEDIITFIESTHKRIMEHGVEIGFDKDGMAQLMILIEALKSKI